MTHIKDKSSVDGVIIEELEEDTNKDVVSSVSQVINPALKTFIPRATFTSICDDTLEMFFAYWDGLFVKPTPKDVEKMFVNQLTENVAAYNETLSSNRFKVKGNCSQIPPTTLARIINHCEIVRRISLLPNSDSDEATLLGIYMQSGDNEGVYTTKESDIFNLILGYSSLYRERDVKEVMNILSASSKSVKVTRAPHLCAVKNGIFNRETKELMPFSPEYVFLYKVGTNYNKDAENVEITMPDGEVWDCESQIDSFSDDEGIRKLLRDIMTCAVYPYHDWGKAFLPYSTKGNNGKGTFAQLLRQMLGNAGCTSISLRNFAKEFYCKDLLHCNAIIVDENDVGAYIDSAECFKACVTQDEITVNRKHKDPVNMIWQGFIMQCLNDYPRFHDRSESMLRRFTIIPFDKSFKGIERPYIKNDYLKREDVREYFLRTALESDVTKIVEPDACSESLEDYKRFNDPLYEFYLSEVCTYDVWKMYPFEFMFEHYKAWHKRNYSSGNALSKINFNKGIVEIAQSDPKCRFLVETGQKRPRKGEMDGTEPKIIEFNLTNFMCKSYQGSDPDKICDFKRKPNYTGCFIRMEKDSEE